MNNTEDKELPVLYEQLKKIIQNKEISAVFQPIISLRDGSLLGYEALSRGPKGTAFEKPEMLFYIAEKYKAIWELEQECRKVALLSFRASKTDAMLFLNVNPSVIEDSKFQKGFTKEYLKEFDMDPSRIIFEITERSAITNIADFRDIIRNYKDQNYKIAIDDAGAGYSGLNLISDVNPDYLKLDMKLIRNIDKDSVKQALVKSMCEFSKITGTYLIAEGIETYEELHTLIHIGIHYGQGYYLSRPQHTITPISPGVIRTIVEINKNKNHLYGYNLSDIYIGNLCVSACLINEGTLVPEVYDLLDKNPDIQGFCVTSEGIVKGIITKDMLYSAVSGVFGYSLNSRQPISSIMEKNFLSLDFKTPINIAGKLAMSRQDKEVYNFITITAEDKYFGIVTIKDLLNKTIEIEVTNATQLNPLTMLPGNINIENALHTVLHSSRKRCVLYFDIDNFKAYNDVYGFEKGDKVIKKLADIITEYVPSSEFVGHLGGDDFVAIVASEKAESICKRIMDQFDSSIAEFYSKEDFINKYIVAKNRKGILEQYPLISISIAGVSVFRKRFSNVFELSAESSRMKKECKVIAGSVYLIA